MPRVVFQPQPGSHSIPPQPMRIVQEVSIQAVHVSEYRDLRSEAVVMCSLGLRSEVI